MINLRGYLDGVKIASVSITDNQSKSVYNGCFCKPVRSTRKQMATNPLGSYHHGDLKASLIEAAKKLLTSKGVSALSLRAIAAEAGVSHGAPYSHFKNKNELLRAVMEEGFEQMAMAMEERKKSVDGPGESVFAFGLAYLEFALQNADLYRLMLGHVDAASEEQAITSKRPFMLIYNAFLNAGKGEQYAMAQAIGCWSLVHGMAALLIGGQIVKPEDISLKEFLRASMPL